MIRPSFHLAPAVLLAAACSSPADKAAEAMADGARAEQAGDLRGARIAYLRAVGYRDDVAGYWLELARLYMRAREPKGAYGAYTRVVELDSANVEALRTLAQLAAGAGNEAEASRYADQLALVAPGDPAIDLARGAVALHQGRFDEALKSVERVLATQPDAEAAILLKAQILFATGKVDDATGLLEGFARRQGDSIEILRALDEIYRKTKDPVRRGEVAGRLWRADPSSEEPAERYARMLIDTGRISDGLKFVHEALARRGWTQIEALRIASTLERAPPGAVSQADLVALGSRLPVEGRVAAAAAALELSRPAAAEVLVRPLVSDEISAANVNPVAVFGLARLAQHDKQTAAALASKVMAFDPGNVHGLELRARLAQSEGRTRAALPDVEQLVRDHPQLLRYRLLQASLYDAEGESQLSLLSLQSAYHDFPDEPAAREAYAAALRRRGLPPLDDAHSSLKSLR